MSATQNKGLEIFVTGLRNQHAVEQQAVSLLSRQVERLEELLGGLGSSHSSLKDAGLSFMGNMAALAHTVAPDEVIKNSFANFAFEHFEIASYKSLLTLSDAVGQGRAQSALKQSLSEEEDMADWIDQHLASTTTRYLQLSMAGETAGV